MQRAAVLSLLGALILFVPACEKLETWRGSSASTGGPPPPVDSHVPPVPPVAEAVTPLAAFVDAAVDPAAASGSPYEQALAYEGSGQLWHARLVLETQALGPTAAPRETELLARVCAAQSDAECVARCEAKLGRKLKLDGGRPVMVDDETPREEPSSDAAKAQRLILKGNPEGARKLLQPKLVAKAISPDELVILRAACERQRDTMCVLACDGMQKK